MHDPSTRLPPPPDRGGVTDAVRAQILATEHWSLLATRSMTWNETFSRAGMFLTVLSAAVVALALVADATDFGRGFRVFALLLLPVVFLLGLGTYIRLSDVNDEDERLVRGMNRLRHAYLELAPELEPYFMTGHSDDEAGVNQTYGVDVHVRPSRLLASTPVLVGLIDAVVAGVLAAMVSRTFGGTDEVSIGIGVVAAFATVAVLDVVSLRKLTRLHRDYRPRFPS